MKLTWTLAFNLLALCVIAQINSTYPDRPYSSLGYFDVDGDKILAAGDCNMAWYSLDGGATWNVSDVGRDMRRVRLVPGDAENRAFMTASGNLYRFDLDEGAIEQIIDTTLENADLTGTLEIVGNTIYLFGQRGVVSSDLHDFEWKYVWQDTSENDYPYVTEVTDNYIYLGMRQGRLLRYDLGTKTMQHRYDFGEWVRQMSFGTDDIGYITSNAVSSLVKTTDGGLSFDTLTQWPENIQPLALGPDTLITVNTNRLYRSTDGGMTSKYIQTANSREFARTSIGQLTDDGTLYLVGDGTMVARSTDLGDSFQFLNAYNRSTLYSMDITQSGYGLAGGTFSTLLKTEDGGRTWAPIEALMDDRVINEIVILSNGKALLMTDSETFVLSASGELETILEKNIYALHYHNDKDYLIATIRSMDGTFQIEKSTDGGSTWTATATLPESSFFISQSPDGRLFVPTRNQGVYISSDDGETWTVEDFGLSNIRSVQFYDENLGLVTGSRELYRTQDGGNSFEEIANVYIVDNVRFLSPDHIIYTSQQNGSTYLFESTNGGENFPLLFFNCTPTNAIDVNAAGQLVLAQDNGHINLVNPSLISSTDDPDHTEFFSLAPNPVHRGDNVQLTGDWKQVSIHTMNGQPVHPVITPSGKLSTHSMPAGFYYIQMEGNGTRAVQKLVVLE